MLPTITTGVARPPLGVDVPGQLLQPAHELLIFLLDSGANSSGRGPCSAEVIAADGDRDQIPRRSVAGSRARPEIRSRRRTHRRAARARLSGSVRSAAAPGLEPLENWSTDGPHPGLAECSNLLTCYRLERGWFS